MEVKVKIKVENLENLINSHQDYSFLNLASISSFFHHKLNDIVYFCDGFTLAKLVGFLAREDISRTSFDYTSLAGDVFEYASKNNLPIYFVGAEQLQITSFIDKILERYKGLNVVGFCDGYFELKSRNDAIAEITGRDIKLLVVSMGAGYQENFIAEVRKLGYEGTSITSGGFIRQQSENLNDYYPQLINSLNLRALYRMYKEPHTIKRYFLSYPLNFFKLILLVICKKIEFKLI